MAKRTQTTEDVVQFAESIVEDLATLMDGDPDKMKKVWEEVKTNVDERLTKV